MTEQHPSLAAGRWREFPLVVQFAHIGSEVERALNWEARGKEERSRRALERGLELLSLTIADPRHRGRLKEMTRLREVLLDYFFGDNLYGSTPESWHRYFHPFGTAANRR